MQRREASAAEGLSGPFGFYIKINAGGIGSFPRVLTICFVIGPGFRRSTLGAVNGGGGTGLQKCYKWV